MPADKRDDLSRSGLFPAGPLSDFQVAGELAMIRREIRSLRDDLATAKANDERFLKMEHNFNILKWLCGLAVAGAMAALVNGVAARVSYRDLPPAAGAASGRP